MCVCGVGSGAMYTLPNSVYNDEVKKVNDSATNNSATYLGMYTFSSSVITAFAQFVCGVLLDIIGFDSKLIDQSLAVQTGLALILFVGIMVVLILSYILFDKFGSTKNGKMKAN